MLLFFVDDGMRKFHVELEGKRQRYGYMSILTPKSDGRFHIGGHPFRLPIIKTEENAEFNDVVVNAYELLFHGLMIRW